MNPYGWDFKECLVQIPIAKKSMNDIAKELELHLDSVISNNTLFGVISTSIFWVQIHVQNGP